MERIFVSRNASILAAAISARPDYFVTGDGHFLQISSIIEQAGLRIMTPAQFLELMK